MQEDRHLKAKRAATGTNAGGWRPSGALLVGLALAAILLVAAFVLGLTTGMGLIVAVPLGLLALAILFFAFRSGAAPPEITGDCPYCGARFKAPAHIVELDCPSCQKRVEIRDGLPVRSA